MGLESEFYYYLQQQQALRKLPFVDDRIFTNQVPANTKQPFIVVDDASRKSVQAMGGPTDLNSGKIQIHIWALDYATQDAIEAVIVNLLDGVLNGKLIGSNNKTAIRSCILNEDECLWDNPTDGSEQGDFHSKLEFDIWFKIVP